MSSEQGIVCCEVGDICSHSNVKNQNFLDTWQQNALKGDLFSTCTVHSLPSFVS